MKNNRRALSIEVKMYAAKLLELFEGEPCKAIYVPVQLKKSGTLVDYYSIIACKEKDVESAFQEVYSNNGKNVEDYKIDEKYCHIATAPKNNNFSHISFDENDDYPVKAEFSEKYRLIEKFFVRCFERREKQIADGEVPSDTFIQDYYETIKNWHENFYDQRKELYNKKEKRIIKRSNYR